MAKMERYDLDSDLAGGFLVKTNTQTTWIRQWGGVCQGANLEDIPLGMFSTAIDMEVDRIGSLVPRKGWDSISDEVTDGLPVKALCVADWDGTDRVFVATAEHVYEWNVAADTYTLIYTIVNKTAKRMLFAVLNASTTPRLIFGNGADPLQKWSGTGSSSACTGAPAGRPVAYKNYLAVFDIPNNPGRVQFSCSPGDPDSWLSNGVARYLEMRGKVTGVYPYVGLVIFTANRAELFSGDPDQAVSMQPLSETDGCVCQETIQDVGGMLVWLSRAGVMAWGGGGLFPSMNMSDPVDKGTLSSIRVDMGRIAWDKIATASAVYDPVNQRYLLATQLQATIGGTPYWRTFVYDQAHSGWWPWSLDASALGMLRDPATNQPSVIAAYDTVLRQQINAQFQDVDAAGAGEAYEYSASSGFWSAEAPDDAKTWRMFTVNATSGYGDVFGGSRTLKLHVRGEFGKVYASDALMAAEIGGFILDVNVLGDRLAETFSVESTVPIALRSKHLQWVAFGSGPDNAVAIAALAISFRLDSPRPIMTA